MTLIRRALQTLLLVALILVARVAHAEPVRVTGLRFSSGQGHTRIVVDLSGPARHTHQILKDPARLVLDVEGSVDPGVGPLAVDDQLISRVRVGTPDGSGARLVFDLKSSPDYRVYSVDKEGGKPNRIVVDFFAPATGPKREVALATVTPTIPDLVAPRKASPAPERPSTPARAPERKTPFVIVVDAGHGGEDPGARGFELEEKDVCLAVATRIVEELNKRSGFKAHLSRGDDTFIPLRKRIQIAERHNADAFVSIHANASKSRAAHGTEVYFLSLSGATDEASRELAHLENSADLIGGVAPEADDALSSILFDMQQTDVQQKGSLLAESVVNSLRDYDVLSTRGVKQAGFVVLKSPRIPSILVETAFITHPGENRLLKSGGFRVNFARRVTDGIVKYFQNVSVAELR